MENPLINSTHSKFSSEGRQTQVIYICREGNKSDDRMTNFSLFIDSWNLLILESAPEDL